MSPYLAFTVLGLGQLLAQLDKPESPPAKPSAGEEVVQKFAFNMGGHQISIPITIEGKDYQFLVVSGSSLTLYDIRLKEHLGPVQEPGNRLVPSGPGKITLHRAPEAFLGKTPLLQPAVIGCVDFGVVLPSNIFGTISVDTLRNYVLVVDYDRGTIIFSDKVPSPSGVPVELHWSARHAPQVRVRLAGGSEHLFTVNTGYPEGLRLQTKLFDELSREEHIQPRRWKDLLPTVATTTRFGEQGYLDEVTLAGSRIKHMDAKRWDENCLGSDYLSQFKVVFDFPGNRIYFQPGARFGKTLDGEIKGFSIAWYKEKVVVLAIDPKGTAAEAGLRLGDIIKSINGQAITRGDLEGDNDSDIIRTLNMSGQKLTLKIKRNGSEYEVTFWNPVNVGRTAGNRGD